LLPDGTCEEDGVAGLCAGEKRDVNHDMMQASFSC
jgi:hypothetical protein